MVRAHLKQTEDKKEAQPKSPPPSTAKKKAADSTTWPCKINGCNKVFAREADLKRHQRTTKSHCVPAFSCPQCDANFTRTDALRRHQKSRHNGVIIESPGSSKSRSTSQQAESSSSVTRSTSAAVSEPASAEDAAPINKQDAVVPPHVPRGSYYRQHTMLPSYGGGPGPSQFAKQPEASSSLKKTSRSPKTSPPGPSSPPAPGFYPMLPSYPYPSATPGVVYAVPHYYQPSPYYQPPGAHIVPHTPPYPYPPPPPHVPPEYLAHYPTYMYSYPPGVYPPPPPGGVRVPGGGESVSAAGAQGKGKVSHAGEEKADGVENGASSEDAEDEAEGESVAANGEKSQDQQLLHPDESPLDEDARAPGGQEVSSRIHSERTDEQVEEHMSAVQVEPGGADRADGGTAAAESNAPAADELTGLGQSQTTADAEPELIRVDGALMLNPAELLTQETLSSL